MVKRRILLLLLAAVMVFSLFSFTGCKTASKEKTLVRLNEVTHSVFYAPQYAAINLGFFEDEGIEIELTNGGGADKVITAILAGQADIGFMGMESAVYVYNEGQEDYAVVVGQLTKRDGAFLVGREPAENFTFEMLRGESVIGGRKGGMPEMVFEYILRQQGLEPNVDLEVRTDIQFNLMGGAFSGGEGDFVTLFEPVASQAEMEGLGYVLTALADYSGEMPYTTYTVRKSFIDKNKDLIERFLRAIARGQKWVNDNTPEKVAEAIAPSFPDSDTELLTSVVKRYKEADVWKLTPELTKDSFEHMQDIMEEAGVIDSRAPFDKIVDNTFAEKAIKNLK